MTRYYLLIHAQFSNKLGEQVVQGPLVFLVFSIQICSEHQNDLEVKRQMTNESQFPKEQLEIQGVSEEIPIFLTSL